MTQFYFDPDRANEPNALPDAEAFYMSAADIEDGEWLDDDNEPIDSLKLEGWYWHACFPGCMPDGEPMGPFETEDEAIADAQNGG